MGADPVGISTLGVAFVGKVFPDFSGKKITVSRLGNAGFGAGFKILNAQNFEIIKRDKPTSSKIFIAVSTYPSVYKTFDGSRTQETISLQTPRIFPPV